MEYWMVFGGVMHFNGVTMENANKMLQCSISWLMDADSIDKKKMFSDIDADQMKIIKTSINEFKMIFNQNRMFIPVVDCSGRKIDKGNILRGKKALFEELKTRGVDEAVVSKIANKTIYNIVMDTSKLEDVLLMKHVEDIKKEFVIIDESGVSYYMERVGKSAYKDMYAKNIRNIILLKGGIAQGENSDSLAKVFNQTVERGYVLAHTASMLKDKAMYIAEDEDIQAIWGGQLCGLKMSNVMKYIPFKKAVVYLSREFGYGNPLPYPIDMRKVAVIEDQTYSMIYNAIVVDQDNNVNMVDHYVDKRKWSDGEIVVKANIPAFAVQFAAMLKGCCKSSPAMFHGTATDCWGKEVNLADYEMIVRRSAFKIGLPPKGMTKEEIDEIGKLPIEQRGFFKSYEEFYHEAVEVRHHKLYAGRIYDTVPSKKFSCYQSMQTITEFTEDDIDNLVSASKEYIDKLHTFEGALTVIPKTFSDLVIRCPEAINVPVIKDAWSKAVEKRIQRIYAGSVPNAAYYANLSCDDYGRLERNEVHCSWLPNGVEVLLHRVPLIGPEGHGVFVNVNSWRTDGMAENVVIINRMSKWWQGSNADVDGDCCYVFASNEKVGKIFVDAAKRTIDKIGNRPVIFPEGDGSTTERLTRSYLRDYMLTMKTEAQSVGTFVNDETRMFAENAFDWRRSALNTFGGNDAVNANGKHDATSTSTKEKTYEKKTYPMFRKYTRNAMPEDKCQWTEGIVDRYLRKCLNTISLRNPEWKKDPNMNKINMLLDNETNDVVVYGLCGKTGPNHTNGVFDKYAFRKTVYTDKPENNMMFLAEHNMILRDAVFAFASRKNVKEETVVALVWRYITLGNNNENKFAILWREFINAFNKEICEKQIVDFTNFEIENDAEEELDW